MHVQRASFSRRCVLAQELLDFIVQVCRTGRVVGAKEGVRKAGGKIAPIWVIRNPGSYNRGGDLPPIGGWATDNLAKQIGKLLTVLGLRKPLRATFAMAPVPSFSCVLS